MPAVSPAARAAEVSYTLGAQVKLRFPTAAESATLTVQRPDGQALVVAPPVRDGADLVATFTPTVPGRYTYRCIDSNGRGWRDIFHVEPPTSLALCSLDGAKQHLNMDLRQHVDDEELLGHIEAATEVIERHRGEVVAARTFTASVEAGRTLPHAPVVRVLSATRTGPVETVDVTSWGPDTRTGLLTLPRWAGRGLVVTYIAGYEVVPPAFVRAAEIIAAHLWETQRMSALGGATTMGEDQYLTPSGLGYAIPNRAVQLLGGRPPVIA